MVQKNCLKPKLIIIIGATATGKSGVAFNLAKDFGGEIISADSVQIYKGLNIGSAKATKPERKEIKHYNIDILGADEIYSAGDFVTDTKKNIKKILKNEKIPIIAGGTILYVQALFEGFNFFGAKTTFDKDSWRQLMANNYTSDQLYNKLVETDSDIAKKVHSKNKKRILRYLQIALEQKQQENQTQIPLSESYDVLIINLYVDREILYERINNRVDFMLANGLVGETKRLIERYKNSNLPALDSIGYNETKEYLEGKITFSELTNLIKQHTRNYAKRQITFLKKIKNAIEIDFTSKNYNKVKTTVKDFLNDNNK